MASQSNCLDQNDSAEQLNSSLSTDSNPLNSSLSTDLETLNSSLSTDLEPLNCTSFSTDIAPLDCSNDTTLSTDPEPLICSDSSSSDDEQHIEVQTSTPIKFVETLPPPCPISPVAGDGYEGVKGRVGKKQRDPFDVLRTKCCSKQCMKNLSALDVELCEIQFSSKTPCQQRQFILNNIHEKSQISVTSERKRVIEGAFVLRGKTVCEKAWCLAHGITPGRYARCQELFQTGVRSIQHGNSEKVRIREKTSEAIAWMRYLFERIGDWMPHKTQIHLPPSYTKKSLYERMVNEFCARGVERTNIISYEHFTSVWSEHLPHFVIAKKSEFTECTICTNLKEKRSKALTDFEQMKVVDMMKQHSTIVERERKEYQTARERARRQPEDMTTVIIDGMDQSKTDVPHLIRRDKGSVHSARLPVHITGVLVHTGVPAGKVPIVFLDTKDVPHDSNLTMNCLLRSLLMQKELLGKTLFLQLDNCFRENKNRYVMAFAELLVQLDVFEEVTMHFLPVGHTHEDIDQLFSCIAAKLKKSNVFTVDDLEVRISESYSPVIAVKRATPLFDIKRWLEPYLYGEFRHHSHPLWFRFRKVDGICRMHWRMLVSSPWEPQLQEETDGSMREMSKGLRCLKGTPLLNPPPTWVKPCLEKMDIPALERDILHGEGYKLRLPESAKSWWKRFLDNVGDIESVPDTPISWPIEDLHGLIHRQVVVAEEIGSDLELIQQALTREYPKVSIGDQGKDSRDRVRVETTRDSISDGQLAAFHLDDMNKRPFIGKILERKENDVTVHWFKGSWQGVWKEMSIGKGKNAKPYSDVVPINSVILWGFLLTPRGCLTKSTKTELQRKYKELDEESSVIDASQNV